MSTPDYNLCDCCGKQVSASARRTIVTDRKMDAAGSMDDVGHTVDVCGDCAREYLYTTILGTRRVVDYEAGSQFIKWVTERNSKLRKR